MNIENAISGAAKLLKDAGVADARRDARTILTSLIGRDAAFVVAHPEYILTPDEEDHFSCAVARRAAREPLQYILGKQEFYGLDLIVTPDVLIPRPETEAVVETAIPILEKSAERRFCDVGTGSGCISVALLKNVPGSSAVGLDISKPALEVARKNAVRHGVSERLELRISDIFSSLKEGDRFDLIASNPPYVKSSEMADLQSEVCGFEPHIALTDGADGLSIIGRIISEAPAHLYPGGALLIEIGFRQFEAVAGMFSPSLWSGVEFLPDLSGIPRVVLAFSVVL